MHARTRTHTALTFEGIYLFRNAIDCRTKRRVGGKWDFNTEAIAKEGQKKLHLLQKLRSFDLDPTALS